MILMEYKEHLISVIIPVYKVEDYLMRCVNSVLEQSYTNLEIILVDDGSPDNCAAICDSLAEMDKRIIVIHKENGGLSDARNAGTIISKGQYITYIDSDDYVSPYYIEYMYKNIIQNDADISCCGFFRTSEEKANFETTKSDNVYVLSGREACASYFTDKHVQLVVAWGKLYKSHLVKNTLYPKGRLHEDEATTFKYLYYSNRVVIGMAPNYAYFENINGIMGIENNKFSLDILWAFNERTDFFIEKKERVFAKKSLENTAAYLNGHYIANHKNKEYINNLLKRYLFSGYFSFKALILILLALCATEFYKKRFLNINETKE